MRRRTFLGAAIAFAYQGAYAARIVRGARVSAGGGGSAITSSVSSSITSGAAPLAVRFDARATTSSTSSITNATNGGTFRQITNAWNFGDSGSGTWAISGQSKNTESGGPLATHVFETAGTYTVNVTHSHSGTTDQAATPITITVSDPNTTFSGTNTICINGTGSSDGLGPSGCAYQASLGTPASNKRYLFKKGSSFSGFQLGGGTITNVRIGSYGSGAKPIITSGVILGGSSTSTDLVVQDLDVRGYIIYWAGHHNMALRCDVTAPSSSVNIYFDETESFLNMTYQYVVECTATDPTRIAHGCLYGVTAKGAILGCDFDYAGEHVIRLPNWYGMQISHNALRRPLATKHCLKLHAATSGSSPTVWDEVSSAAANTLASSFGVVSHNIGGTTDSDQVWTFTSDPQNNSGSQPEGISDVIFEYNQFHINAAGSRKDITRGGRRITDRGNTNIDGTFIEDQSENVLNIPSGWDGPYFSS